MSTAREGRLLVAVPSKGRMAPPALELLAAAGLRFEAGERALHVPCRNAPVDLLLVRPHDIPEYVQDGVVHLGITGANLVAEAEADVVRLADLGFARCTLEAAVPVAAPQQAIADLAGLRVATAYPVSTRAALAEVGVEAELIPVSGSVEAAPRLGLSEAVVDLVSTGSTASANGLRRIGSLLSSEAVLIANRQAVETRRELVDRLQLMLEGVVAARNRRYLMLNAAETDLPAIRAILPGMGAPSVLPLAEHGQIAVHAAVEVDDIWELLPLLKARRRLLDPRRPGREARAVTSTAEIVADVRAPRGRRGRRMGRAARGREARAGCGRRRARRALRFAPCARLPLLSRRSHAAQRPADTSISPLPGIEVERRWLPLDSVGIYVPAGLLSSLVMTAVPARVAGVSPDRGRHAASLTRDARHGARARGRRGLLDGRRAGDRRARLRHRDDRAGREDRRPRQPLGDRGEAARLRARRDRSSRRAERGARDRRRHRRPGRVRRRPARPGGARARRRGDPRHDERRVADAVRAPHERAGA